MNISTLKNKTKRAVLLLLLVLLSATVARAQYATVPIGEGNYSEWELPFATSLNYSLTQQIYLAEEIGMAGTITALSFHYDHAHYYYFYNDEFVEGDDYTTPFSLEGLQVYLKYTDRSEFSVNDHVMVPLSESDKVWEGTFAATGAGWVTINFDTPFEYDGVSNLLVCCYDPTEGYFDDLVDPFGYHTGDGGLVFSSHELEGNSKAISTSSYDEIPSLSPNTYVHALGGRNNIQLHFETDYPNPVNLVVSDLTDMSATLSWEAPQATNTITGYAYQYKKNTDTEWSDEVTTTGTYASLNGLAGGTPYRFRVKALYGNNESIYTNTGFTTIAIPLPNLAVSDITNESAMLSWEAPETSYTITGYAYQYKKTTDTEWSAEATTTSTFVTLVGLSDFSEYQFRAKALFSDHESSWTFISFFTAVLLPYEQGFENGMVGWSMVDCYWAGIPWGGTAITGPEYNEYHCVHTGSFGFRFSNILAFDQYLISPLFYCNSRVSVSFSYKNYYLFHATFQVGYSTTTKDLDAFTWGDTITSTSTHDWQQYTDVFPVGTKYIAVKWIEEGGDDLFLDDFSFEEYSPYPKPTNLAASNLAEHGASLTWTAPETSQTVTGYVYQYKLVNEWVWSAETTVNSISVTLSGLSPNTSYDFRVKALYAGGLASNYTTTSFMTEGVIEPLPHYQGFENGMGGWRVVDGAGSTGIYYNSQYNIHSFRFDCDNNTPQYLISPQFNSNSSMKVSFSYQNSSDGTYSYLADFQVGYSTTTKDLDAFTWGDTITSSHQWQQYIIGFPGGTKYVAVRWVGGYFLFLDDFSFEGFIIDEDHSITENFTNNTAFPPLGWENPSVVVDGVNRQWIWDWFFYHYDSGSAYSSRYGTTYLKLPDLYLSDSVNSAQLSFWSLYTGLSDYAKCSVVLLDGDNETELWTPDVGPLQNERWYEIHIDLSAYMGQTISLAFKHEGNNISTWSIDNLKISVPMLGAGTEQNPYIINSVDTWNYFCDCLQDNDTWNRFSGKYVKLGADITVTRMAGSSTHDFMGTFDGQGHTLTVAFGTAEEPFCEEYAAPFST